ncbi:MAG: J domain-containing protein [Desulfobacterales bacterium]
MNVFWIGFATFTRMTDFGRECSEQMPCTNTWCVMCAGFLIMITLKVAIWIRWSMTGWPGTGISGCPTITVHAPCGRALSVMEIEEKELANLTVKKLTRQYRYMARKFHPDTGGGHNWFIRLNQAFEDSAAHRAHKEQIRRIPDTQGVAHYYP